MKTNRYLLCFVLLIAGALPTFSQVSNDNEDEVYKIDGRAGQYDFVPGQVLVKFKDETSIQVQRTARGQYRAASISAVDKLLRQYGVKDMEKLFPAEVAKPKSQLRRKAAPNGTIVEEKNLDKVFWIKTGVESIDSTMQLIDHLKEMPEVEYAEPNYRVYITADMPTGYGAEVQTQQSSVRRSPAPLETTASMICPDPNLNPLYTNQYNIRLHNIDKLWDKPIINKKRPVIAILDTGVDINHPDLKDNIWTNTAEVEGERAFDDDGNGIVDDKYGWNFVDNYYDLTDRNGHGTHVAGIAAAADNIIGIVGANPQAQIMPVKVMNDRGQGDIATYCRGMVYAADMGADIINMSFGHSGWISQAEIDAIQKAYITTILVASAGNNGASVYSTLWGPLWPAAYYLVLGVQSCGTDGNRVAWSNYDPDGPIFSEDGIDGRNHEMLLAGVDIYSTLPNGQYNKLSGTSMSAPLLSGAISALQMVKEYPSKDVLFGDLIHLNADFEKIYSDETPRTPKIDLVALYFDDSESGNGDGMVDAGETVDFKFVLRNTWADATDIQLTLTVPDEEFWDLVNIKNPKVNFGYSLSAYGRETCKTPIKVKFANNIGQNTRMKFGFEIRCNESDETITKDIYVTVYNMVKLGGLISSDMTLTADRNYFVTSNLAIPDGVTLTVEPGTTIKFAKGKGISCNGALAMKGTRQKLISLEGFEGNWEFIHGRTNPKDTIEYCRFINASPNSGGTDNSYPAFKDCIFENSIIGYVLGGNYSYHKRCHITNNNLDLSYMDWGSQSTYNINECNFVNNTINRRDGLPNYTHIKECNYVNNTNSQGFMFIYSGNPGIITSPSPSYLGTSREDIANTYIYDIDYDNGYTQVDLSNILKVPVKEAHGIVWKVVVNGYDAQDEYEQLPPLGVAKHKFEVYFNRPMNKLKIPQITFGVREPYNQHSVDEDGSWNEEGTIYTAYKTITGRTMSDGVNRVYVQGAEDDEFFECPYEKTRFNINIQAAGSMATGFAAEAGLGKVKLTWNNSENNFEDAMGFNIYRYQLDGDGNEVSNTCINKEIVDLETTEYVDYNVVPGTTYYYMYKVLSTDLKEYDVSNVVAATPLTSELGDANGDGDVDVSDVITTVNYAAGMEPKPFIYEAADMNKDQSIDILDVIGIIQKILNPATAEARVMAESTATYTIEDGVLYVESPVELAGVQVQIALNEKGKMGNEKLVAADDLKGFEQASAWLTESDYLLLAYNMSGKTLTAGKHALLTIGDGELTTLRLSDAQGHQVVAVPGEATIVRDAMGSKVMNAKGVYNLNGQKVVNGQSLNGKLPKGVYIINGEKVVK